MTNEPSPATLSVRTISPEDSVAVAELCAQLGYEATATEVRERIDTLLSNPEQVALVACLDIEVVGWIEAAVIRHIQSPAHALIGGLVVKDHIRSLGIGKQLCAEVETWSRAKGLTVVRVTSRSTRESAHRFYLREGYSQTKISAVFEKLLP
ncbi:GNAT family N-acetyltransferase [Granulicella arctica]|uniref:GNAT superfamily N-acetyltransferase n=1 Tax=Granulicella arctica TaxID=940613 RepID=A0A7Y9PDC2_9BACT|nr:GNAT superfamily N-acetyltransferase [Granulicella arctica]